MIKNKVSERMHVYVNTVFSTFVLVFFVVNINMPPLTIQIFQHVSIPEAAIWLVHDVRLIIYTQCDLVSVLSFDVDFMSDNISHSQFREAWANIMAAKSSESRSEAPQSPVSPPRSAVIDAPPDDMLNEWNVSVSFVFSRLVLINTCPSGRFGCYPRAASWWQ